MFRKAMRYFSISNMLFILLEPYLEYAVNTYGFLSFQHWFISIIVYVVCIMAIYFAMLLENKVDKLGENHEQSKDIYENATRNANFTN